MSTNRTVKMLRAYVQISPVTLFFAGMFQAPPENFHNSEEVEIDIVRDNEDVAIAITDLSTGYRMNQEEIYTNKAFKPPILKEAFTVNGMSLIGREPGFNPFEDQGFMVKAAAKAMRGFTKVDAKIRRTMELQASQILQTGIVTLVDASGTAVYSIDYKPKAAHFPTVGTAWSTFATATPLQDISSLANTIRTNGKASADTLVFGETAWFNFIQNPTVQALLDNRRMELGGVRPSREFGEGATFQGFVWIGNYRYDMWTYDGEYKHPATGVATKFLAADKVIVRASSGRLDATFGNVPRIVPPDARVLPILPDRMSITGAVDLIPNAWVDAPGENLYAGLASRPLMIPTAIDTYGCIDTEP